MAKHKPDAMVDGMFMGASLLKSLLDLIIERGGLPEQLHFLTTERGHENLKRVADCIIESPWQVPKSLMESLSMKLSAQRGYDSAAFDRYHYWELAADELGLPITTFRDAEHRGCRCEAELAPQELLDQIHGKRFERKTMVVTVAGEQYVVLGMSGGNLSFGGLIEKDFFDHIKLTPLNRFDMTR